MKHDELIEALRRLKVETGSLACLGCGHEHNCSTQGCAILREAVEELEKSVPVVRCRECIHQPHLRSGYTETEDEGYSLEFPDEICPFYCPDEWYNAEPPKGFYCAHGEKAR